MINAATVPFPAVPAGARRFDSGGPTLAEAGEDEVLRDLATLAAGAQAPSLVLGPGDDAAVWRPPAGAEVAVTQDALVEDRDFRREWITPRGLGRRALTVALSDLAAMGATPAWCTATLCAPASTQLEDVLEIQRGLVAAAAEVGCAVAGGDLSDTPGGLVLDVAAGGTAHPGQWLRRRDGRAGDALAVTGRLGAAAAGLEALRAGRDDVDPAWLDAFLAPVARLAEGQRLAETGVRCAGDVSDGLLVDAGRTAVASGCGVEIWLDRIPVAAGLREALPDSWLDLALAGGEDFELLCAGPPVVLAELAAGWPAGLAPLHLIGRLTRGAGITLLDTEHGSPQPLPPVRSRHWG